ncbi:MAG: CapA family protein [Candidatus Krumholzibacteria bacterium]|nr:CapA family protein [Candidatus Krumholzibacteria bacterium]
MTRILTILLSLSLCVGLTLASTVIEDFESGSVILESYPGQDQAPSSWELTTLNTWDNSDYALRIFGNSWKQQMIPPFSLQDSMTLQLAVYVEGIGEMQAIGIGDGSRELLYTVSGDQLPQASKWWTVYQGAFSPYEWKTYLLPVGEDWRATWGEGGATIDRLFYINDDDAGPSGATVFDAILDVSADLPVAPVAEIQRLIRHSQRVSPNRVRLGIQFLGLVSDPDSESHDFAWDFGDGTFSSEQNPWHEFTVEAGHPYTVTLEVFDPEGLSGVDSCKVAVDSGEGDLPLTVNFVGDIMTGRSYESPGGIIDTHGIEALFAPTMPIFGDAADLSVCNLEVSYTDQGSPHPTKSVVFRSRPENIEGVVYAGVDLANLGNNHIIDYGEAGMLQTQALLDSVGIPWVGAGTDDYFALRPKILGRKGLSLAFLSMCNRDGRLWNYQPFLDAGRSKPGFGSLIPKNLEKALEESRPVADLSILQLHSGSEYETAPPDRAGHFHGKPPIEVSVIHEDDEPFHFRVEPSEGDRALRRMAIDMGADAVINHHPHVLQGFESYQGKLIAHSLGNFIFDLYYPETMPTMVLTMEIAAEGIVGYRFTPSWIDDWIPQPVTGNLAREIRDRLADYSRDMGVLVSPLPGSVEGRIHLNPDEVNSTVFPATVTTTLQEQGTYYQSPPLELPGEGCLSRLVSVEGLSQWEVSWGREILWHGGFEEEGASFWDDNTADEWLDDTESWKGQRSLALRRESGAGSSVGTDLEKHLPCDPEKRHSARGFLKAQNADGAKMMFRFYEGRYSSSPLSSTDLALPLSGDSDWQEQFRELATPVNASYFEMRCHLEEATSGIARAWFDELACIEWEPWQPGPLALEIPAPNNYRYLQIRSSSAPSGSVVLHFEETLFGSPFTSSLPPELPARATLLAPWPNPFNPQTRLRLKIPEGGGRVDLSIHDVRGRRILDLHQGTLEGGSHDFLWTGRDKSGRRLPSGIYLARLKTESGDLQSRKLVLLK